MVIVSSAKVRKDIREDLRHEFPDIDFRFHHGMENAQHDLPEADILITYGEDLTEELVAYAKQLKWVMVMSAGLEHMPFEALQKNKITVTNARGIHKIPMAEYTIAAMLQTAKQMNQWYENQQQANWERTFTMQELADKTITIVGPGAIGAEIARLAKAFRMKTIGVNRSGSSMDYIDQIYTVDNLVTPLAVSDYVVSVLPYTEATDQLVGSEHFAAMKNDAVFINIGRGKTVDEAALIKALQQGQIGQAVLDVFEEEPLPDDHPFWKMSQVTVTPHFSGITSMYQPRGFEIFKRNLQHFINETGEWENLIDLTRGY